MLTTAAVAGGAGAPAATAAIPVPAPLVDGVGRHAATDPADLQVLVNKAYPVTPRDWAPERLTRPDVRAVGGNDQLRPVAAHALERLAAASERATGRELVLQSGYRDADTQQRLYRRYVERDGRAAADTYSARGGYSEHQTGLAADVSEAGTPYTRFDGTRTSRWVEAHAWRYGFVVRYPRGARAVTGYAPEAWHLRYVGVGLAAHMHVAGVTTLEEASGTGPAPDYPPR
ncbi:M15 family metallopeptidase [Isoptericola cucumis]|uniref:M15 family metallopeptidase n=1 Tax=Isoptericola cucumis TaxID=1776856 RepID=UPI00320B8164